MTIQDSADEDQQAGDLVGSSAAKQVVIVACLGILITTSSVGLGQHVSVADSSNYFATASQVIATLFIAIVFESFSTKHGLWRANINGCIVLILLGLSLFGLFASFRGLLGESGPVTIGIAAAGLLSSSCLVCLALLERLRNSLPVSPETMLLFFVAPSTLAFAIL